MPGGLNSSVGVIVPDIVNYIFALIFWVVLLEEELWGPGYSKVSKGSVIMV